MFGARYVCDFQAKYNGMHGKQCGGCGTSAVGMKAWDGCVGTFIQIMSRWFKVRDVGVFLYDRIAAALLICPFACLLICWLCCSKDMRQHGSHVRLQPRGGQGGDNQVQHLRQERRRVLHDTPVRRQVQGVGGAARLEVRLQRTREGEQGEEGEDGQRWRLRQTKEHGEGEEPETATEERETGPTPGRKDKGSERASKTERREGRHTDGAPAPLSGARYVCDFQAKYNGMHGKQCGGCGTSAVGMKAWDGCVGTFFHSRLVGSDCALWCVFA